MKWEMKMMGMQRNENTNRRRTNQTRRKREEGDAVGCSD